MPKAHLILPPTRPNIWELRKLPFFYLGGPVKGGGDWQYEMTTLLEEIVGRCVIAHPSPYRAGHPHYVRRLPGEADFVRQKLWERHYMALAAKDARRGALIFWLPKESPHHPRQDGKPYAMDTRGEVGEWRGRLMQDRNLRVIVGAEGGFPGLEQIVCDFDDALGSEFELYSKMENVAKATYNLIRPRPE